MMRQDFLQVLEHDLSSLPVQAREEALAFFTEYLAEVGESSDALAELGDPHQVAQDLLSEMKAQGIPMEMREVMVLEDSKIVVTKKVSVFLEDIDLMIREADVTQLTLDYPSNLSTFLQVEQGDEQFSIKQV
ncbi:HAAS signaling domain-containing protein, partial [Streptococcus dysgalactiae]